MSRPRSNVRLKGHELPPVPKFRVKARPHAVLGDRLLGWLEDVAPVNSYEKALAWVETTPHGSGLVAPPWAWDVLVARHMPRTIWVTGSVHKEREYLVVPTHQGMVMVFRDPE